MSCISRLLLNMKLIQLIFIFISISLAAGITGPEQVFGTVGETVTIRCQYHAYYKNYAKYLCKGSSWRSCSVIACSSNQQDGTDKRITIMDNQTTAELFITMTQLTIRDTGHYWCGITSFGFDKMAELHLNITEALTTLSPTLPYEVQGTVHPPSQSTTNLSVCLGIMFGIVIIAAVFIIRYRKYSAVGEKGFRYIGEETNSVTTSGSSRDEGGSTTSGTTTKSSTETQEGLCYIHETSVHEKEENF
ncbi:CMRF35-like molecule 5 [Mobula birostris]|uniref:CMRF35-like molecule 5 n=1 Tax=Mobula birostris TaxID=1983395 RepID=UPI003B28830A